MSVTIVSPVDMVYRELPTYCICSISVQQGDDIFTLHMERHDLYVKNRIYFNYCKRGSGNLKSYLTRSNLTLSKKLMKHCFIICKVTEKFTTTSINSLYYVIKIPFPNYVFFKLHIHPIFFFDSFPQFIYKVQLQQLLVEVA